MQNCCWFRSGSIFAHSILDLTIASFRRRRCCCCCVCVCKRAYHFCDLFAFAVTFTASDADTGVEEWRIAIRKNTLTDGLFQSPNEYWQKQEHSLELIDRQFRLNTLHARCAFFFTNLFASFHYVSCYHPPSWYRFEVVVFLMFVVPDRVALHVFECMSRHRIIRKDTN